MLFLGFGAAAHGHEGTWGEVRPLTSIDGGDTHELQSPVSANGKEIFFASFRPGTAKWDIFVARRTDPAQPFDDLENLSTLNSDESEYPSFLTADGLELYLFSNRDSSVANAHDIFVARRESVEAPFEPPEPIRELNTIYHEGTATLTANGKEMAFISNRPGGAGNRDLWLARRDEIGAPWEVVRNIRELNTPDRDRSPSLSADGLTLFFDRWPTAGAAAELWCATRDPVTGFFRDPRRITSAAVNSAGWNGVPVISASWPADGSELYWSRCEGPCEIYVATWRAGASFLRGECNDDARVNISDSIFALEFLFDERAEEPDCVAACDANDDGEWNISDAVYLLQHLFAGGPEPPPPFPDCGSDLDPDSDPDSSLRCARESCE